MTVPPQCQYEKEKGCMIFDSGMMTRRESRASLVEEWNFMLTPRLCEHL